jgi:hypothetical protein
MNHLPVRRASGQPFAAGAEDCSVSQGWLSGSSSAKGPVGRCGLAVPVSPLTLAQWQSMRNRRHNRRLSHVTRSG